MEVLDLAENVQIALSCIALFAVLVVHQIARQTIRRLPIHLDQKLRARRTSRYSLAVAFAAFLLIIWAEDLKDAALIVSAFAVAIVLSLKEVIMCMTGWWLKLAGGHFQVGDRIEIDGLIGDVMDYGVLTITLLEVEPNSVGEQRSGSVVTIPNSLLLSKALTNQTKAFSYRWHSVLIRVKPNEDWQESEKALIEAGDEVWAEFAADAERQAHEVADKFSVQTGDAKPAIYLSQAADGTKTLELRIGLPVRDARKVEDQVLRAYFSKLSVHAKQVH